MMLAFFICFLATSIGGICGIGGGVIIKPVLDVMGIMTVSAASFLSGLTVLSMSIVNVWKSRKGNELDANKSIPLGIGAAVGGIFGKRLFEILKGASQRPDTVVGVQSVVLCALVIGTLLYVLNKSRISTRDIRNPATGVLIGTFLGICSSFLGIGGGPMNLAVLYYFFSMTPKKASINSILVILISQTCSLLVTLVTGKVPAFDWQSLILMIVGGVSGGFVSSALHKKIDENMTVKLFIGLMVVIIGICAMNAIKAFT